MAWGHHGWHAARRGASGGRPSHHPSRHRLTRSHRSCLSWVVGGHGVVTHGGVSGMHGGTGWRPSMVGQWCSVMWWGPSRVHA